MLQALLTDLETDQEICDLTPFSTIKLSPRLSAPRGVEVTLAGDTQEVRGLADDGYPIVQVGRRGIKILRNGVLRANTILWGLAPDGDQNTTRMLLQAHDPMVLFLKRFARDAGGTIGNPQFAGSSGAAILQEAIQGSIDFVGPLPIDITGGALDLGVPPAVDLSSQLMDWPMKISELSSLLTNSGKFDVVMEPVDTAHTGAVLGVMGQLQAVNRYGSDLSSSVHLDYATGDHGVAGLRRFFDMDGLCNSLRYLLGPRLNPNHWPGSIEGTDPEFAVYAALQVASQAKFLWVYEDIRMIFDDMKSETDFRPLANALWKTEVVLRVEPQQLLFLTPAAGDGCPFKPFDDYSIGDTISTNLADIVGPEIAGGTQRIYGFDITQEPNGPERVSELIIGPDRAVSKPLHPRSMHSDMAAFRRELDALKQRSGGPWVYVGAADGPAFEGDFGNADGSAPMRFRWLIDGNLDIEGGFDPGTSSPGNTIFTLPGGRYTRDQYQKIVIPRGDVGGTAIIRVEVTGEVIWVA